MIFFYSHLKQILIKLEKTLVIKVQKAINLRAITDCHVEIQQSLQSDK